MLKFPNKSHRKKVILPPYSLNLAEFFGIMMGDGGINNDWQTNISLNAQSDIQYAVYTIKLSYSLFGIIPKVRVRFQINTLILSLDSITIVEFLVANGLVKGNKLKEGLVIPDWIMQEKKYRRAAVRGLVDTDGCLYMHVHKSKWNKTYKNLGFNFSSYSPTLILQVAEILEENGIKPHINTRGTGIYLYKVSAIEDYLKIFGSSNPRITSIYQQWRDARVV